MPKHSAAERKRNRKRPAPRKRATPRKRRR